MLRKQKVVNPTTKEVVVEKERLDLQKETDMLNNVLKEIESLG